MQPSVLVYLSKVTDLSFKDDPSVLLSPQSTALVKDQTRRWVSVGTLVILKVGDIWHNQSLYLSPDYESETFSRIKISGEFVDLVKAGLSPDETDFLIPLVEHPWHMQATQSYCRMLTLKDERRVIVPCIELIRFYFGSSSSLLTKLFVPPMQKNALFQDNTFQPKSGHLSIELGEGISGSSAAAIGRMCLAESAWQAAVSVGTSMLDAAKEKRPIYPKGNFPFEGTTELRASGKWLSFGETKRATFLVYKLTSCSHRFPFKSIKYQISGEKKKPFFDQPRLGHAGQSDYRGSAPDSSNQSIKEADGSKQLESKTRNFSDTVTFPDLVGKPIWKSKKLTLKQWMSQKLYAGGQALDSAALGVPDGYQRVRPIELARHVKRKSQTDKLPPEFIREILKGLKLIEGLEITLLTESDDDGWSIPVPLIENEDAVVEPKLLVEDPLIGIRLRRACVLSLKDERDHCLMVIIEDKPSFSKLYLQSNNDDTSPGLSVSMATKEFAKSYD